MLKVSFSQAMRILYDTEPVLGALISRCDLQWDKDGKYVKTAGVAISKNQSVILFINPEYFYNLIPECQVGLLFHEAMHLLLKHISLDRISHTKKFNPLWLNYMMDVEIDQNIPDKIVFTDPMLPFTVKGLENSDNNKDWLYYYEKYEQYCKENNIKEETPDIKNQVLQISSFIPNQNDEHIFEQDNLADVELEMSNSMKEFIIKNLVDLAIKDSEYLYGNGQIKSPYVDQVIKQLLKPSKIRWELYLQNLFGNMISVNPGRTFTRPNKKLGYIAPGSKDGKNPSILIFIDESGSHDEELRLKAFNEIKKILEDYKEEVSCYAFSDGIFDEVDLFDSDIQYLPKRKGYGGTSFVQIFEKANSHEEVDAIFILTDGDGRFPDKNPIKYQVYWGLTNGDRKIPFGHKVVID